MTSLLAPTWACLGRLIHSQLVSNRSEFDSWFVNEVSKCTDRFRKGDWGDLCEEDYQVNLDTIKAAQAGSPGGTLMGSYKTACPNPVIIWIITIIVMCPIPYL